MRILFLSELFYPHGGGAEFATYLISKKLAEAGHQIRVITNRFRDEAELEVSENFEIIRKNLITNEKSVKYSLLLKYRIHKKNWMRENLEWAQIVYIPRYWYTIISEIKKMGKPVLVHLHDYIAVCPVANLFDSNKSSTCASVTCSYSCIYNYERLKGSNILYSALSSIVNSSIGRYMGQMIEKCDAILCVSNNQRDLITNIAPNLKDKISVVPNPLPAIDYIEIKSKGLAYFGGSSPFKGYQVLIQALEQLEDPNVKFKFAGFRDLKEITKKDPRVEYYGWIKGSELENVYRGIHAVVIPSIIAEPAPYVVNEALLHGRLIIASDIGGIPEQVEGFEGCYLFNPGDSSQLATTIKEALSISIDEAREIGYRNREKLLNKGPNDIMLETFEALAKRVIMKDNRARG